MTCRKLKGGMLRFLTRKEIRDIHGATLDVLERVGMRSDSERILKVFLDAGAKVDFKNKIVRIPEHLIEQSLKKAPRQMTLCGRDSKCDLLLEDDRIYFGLGGTPCPFIRDIETESFRRSTKSDVADVTRLGDTLPNISFIMSLGGAFDVPYEVEYLHELEALFNNTVKPVIYSMPGADIAKKALLMAAAVVGGPNELRKRPILALQSETVSPLTFALENENIIEFAEAGIPVAACSDPMAGATAPMTMVGAFVVANAESLAGITLTQLVNPHAPTIYGAWGGVMDPRTARFSYGAPERALIVAVLTSQMARYYGLPSYGYAGCSDSKLPDAQAGAEVFQISLMSALSGVTLMHDAGYLAGGSVGSMEMVVICDEIYGMISRIVRGLEVNDETLAVDVISSVGPGGHFLSHKHTLKFVERELYLSKLFDRTSETTWTKAGKKDIREVAREKVKKMLKEHRPEPLPSEIKLRLAEIVKEAEKRTGA